MDYQSKNGFLNRLIAMYAKADFPVAILDREFNILWCSDTAKLSSPCLSLPDGAHTLLSGRDLSRIKEEIAVRGSFSTANSGDLFSEPSVSLCALPENCPDLYLMQISTPTPQGTGMKPEGLSRVLSSLNSQYRTPLSMIFSTLSVLVQDARQTKSGPELAKIMAHYETINQNSYLILRNCELMTTYTRLSSGLSPVRPVRMDLYSYLNSLFEVCADLTERNEIPLNYDIPKGILTISCDQSKLVCAIMCVLSNSCGFTKEGNSIDIRVRRIENNVSISISDLGLGIPAHIQPHIFEPYFSYNPQGGPFAGNGLGLPTAKFAVCALGGTIALTSVENEGTTVVFTLPIIDNDFFPPAMNCDTADYLNDRFSIPWIYLSNSVQCPLS